MAASAVSPRKRAPSAATVIRVSMAKGEPLRVNAHALRATGQSPQSVARVKSGWPSWAGSRAATPISAASDRGCQYLPRSVIRGLSRLSSLSVA